MREKDRKGTCLQLELPTLGFAGQPKEFLNCTGRFVLDLSNGSEQHEATVAGTNPNRWDFKPSWH